MYNFPRKVQELILHFVDRGMSNVLREVCCLWSQIVKPVSMLTCGKYYYAKGYVKLIEKYNLPSLGIFLHKAALGLQVSLLREHKLFGPSANLLNKLASEGEDTPERLEMFTELLSRCPSLADSVTKVKHKSILDEHFSRCVNHRMKQLILSGNLEELKRKYGRFNFPESLISTVNGTKHSEIKEWIVFKKGVDPCLIKFCGDKLLFDKFMEKGLVSFHHLCLEMEEGDYSFCLYMIEQSSVLRNFIRNNAIFTSLYASFYKSPNLYLCLQKVFPNLSTKVLRKTALRKGNFKLYLSLKEELPEWSKINIVSFCDVCSYKDWREIMLMYNPSSMPDRRLEYDVYAFDYLFFCNWKENRHLR